MQRHRAGSMIQVQHAARNHASRRHLSAYAVWDTCLVRSLLKGRLLLIPLSFKARNELTALRNWSTPPLENWPLKPKGCARRTIATRVCCWVNSAQISNLTHQPAKNCPQPGPVFIQAESGSGLKSWSRAPFTSKAPDVMGPLHSRFELGANSI